jgi:predicted P-loop ATPase
MTGNRRWLVFETDEIDYMHNINPDKLWAQVHHLWKSGYKHWFDTTEIKQINKSNEQFRTVTLEEEMVLRFFRFNSKNKKGELLSSSEVIQKIIANVPSFNNKMAGYKMGKALSKHSKHKLMKGGIQRYYVDYCGIEHDTSSPNPDVNVKNKNKRIIEDDEDLPF